MGEASVTKEGLVNLRGVFLPVDNVRVAMLETGGIPVSDEEINRMLDKAMVKAGRGAEALVIDAIQDHYFLPVWMNIYGVRGMDGIWVYFAVPNKKIYA